MLTQTALLGATTYNKSHDHEENNISYSSYQSSSTLLDLFATNSPKNVTLAKVIPSTLSDHELLVVVRKINAGKLPPRSIECRNFSKYDQRTFIEDLEKCSWDDVYSERDVNSAWSKWKELFLSVCNKHAPIRHKVLRGIICPWLTSATKKLMNERDSFLRKARKTGSEVDWSTYRRLRNQVSNRIKIEKRRYQRNEIQNNLANPKSFWRAMKSIFPNKERKSSTVQCIITDEGETITSKSTSVEKFNIVFTNTVSKLLEFVQSTTFLGLCDEKFTNESFVLQPVSQIFIFKQLKDLKVKKATGLDGISAWFLKDGASVIAPTVTFLVNLSLFTGIVPCDWKIARIAPFISLADMKVWTTTDQSPFCRLIMSKIMEKAVNVQLQRYRQRFDLLSPFQPGLDNTIQRRVL